MKYIFIEWIHTDVNEPNELYSELNDDRFEVRKIELYRNGKAGTADLHHESNGAMLSYEPVPDLEIIGMDPQFKTKEISEEQFNILWEKYRNTR
jgi:hypothetical protein